MLTHFQYKEIKNNLINQEWNFSFFYKQKEYNGTYFKDGSITWKSAITDDKEKSFLESCVHDLMLYHVYEEH
ncbi:MULTISPECIES: DUF5342 family protein [Bacillaceae]|uniref:YheE family protein n=1 Tax=Evansella alkalicola TaxID=745819 RepID=A0ABS6JQA3_9BACI|nr:MULTISPECIES: DUF5342 family protein [Bacillaceae]MBU9720744.1 YheE family protein [Bacillus alkalicola]